jgi:hypothetical protein
MDDSSSLHEKKTNNAIAGNKHVVNFFIAINVYCKVTNYFHKIALVPIFLAYRIVSQVYLSLCAFFRVVCGVDALIFA